ncbi:MFS transporter [Nocardia tenerifensis]|uniref:MFS transporter n=1 Tax=Nocardia tenerifensis TaxID=228006 RepID=A0A318KPD1_9NOCA|nr:MFS transporter [Nocardia tenerifensis]PXX71540.1 MFS transporter [Nocardia tenerifensis]
MATPEEPPSHGAGSPDGARPRRGRRLLAGGERLTQRGVALVRHAARADGAYESGLTALVRATVANFATDAAIAVALANTLFFASPATQSRVNVALYLLMTVAPFAVIAPVIGPLLDRLQRGRRLALATTFGLRVLVAIGLIFSLDGWALYPLALGSMVLSKSFSVLKSAVTPRVLPPGIDLVRTNSRLTVFGLVGGSIVAGGLAAAAALVFHSTGALVVAALLAAAGAFLSLRIPPWVEVTEGETPTTLSDRRTRTPQAPIGSLRPRAWQPLGRPVIAGLWGNGAIRVLTGFLTFYIAFVAKSSDETAFRQALMLAAAGAAAGVGNFTGNFVGARLALGRPAAIILSCTGACLAITIVAAVQNGPLGAVLATLVASASTALAKVSLDASIQDDLPPESIASGFGRTETVLQLAWVLGGALGVLLPTVFRTGFTVVAVVLALALLQSALTYRGHSMLPRLGGRRPELPKATARVDRPSQER